MRPREIRKKPSEIGALENGRRSRARRMAAAGRGDAGPVAREVQGGIRRLNATSECRVLAAPLGAGAQFMFAGFVFVVPLPDLLLDLFRNEIDRRIQIILDVLREKVRTGNGNTHRTGELALRRAGAIMFE